MENNVENVNELARQKKILKNVNSGQGFYLYFVDDSLFKHTFLTIEVGKIGDRIFASKNDSDLNQSVIFFVEKLVKENFDKLLKISLEQAEDEELESGGVHSLFIRLKSTSFELRPSDIKYDGDRKFLKKFEDQLMDIVENNFTFDDMMGGCLKINGKLLRDLNFYDVKDAISKYKVDADLVMMDDILKSMAARGGLPDNTRTKTPEENDFDKGMANLMQEIKELDEVEPPNEHEEKIAKRLIDFSKKNGYVVVSPEEDDILSKYIYGKTKKSDSCLDENKKQEHLEGELNLDAMMKDVDKKLDELDAEEAKNKHLDEAETTNDPKFADFDAMMKDIDKKLDELDAEKAKNKHLAEVETTNDPKFADFDAMMKDIDKKLDELDAEEAKNKHNGAQEQKNSVEGLMPHDSK